MDRKQIKLHLMFWYFILWVILLIALYLSYAVYFVNTTSTKSKWVGLFAGAVAIMLACCKICETSFHGYKDMELKRITGYYFNGTAHFIKSQIKLPLCLVIILIYPLYKYMGLGFSVSFVTGAFISALTTIINDYISTRSAVKICAENDTLNTSYKLAYNSGVVIALSSMGLCISSIVILFHIFKDYQTILGFIVGAAIISIPFIVGTSMSKKATFEASNVLSNYFEGIEQSDRRNPLLLLRGISYTSFLPKILCSDTFITFGAIMTAAMCVGSDCFNLMGQFLPIAIAANGLFATIIVILFTKISKIQNPTIAFYVSGFFAILILTGLSYYSIHSWLPDAIGLVISIFIGAVAGYIITFINTAQVFDNFKPVRNITNASIVGGTSAIIRSLKEAFASALAPILIIAVAIILSFVCAEGIEFPLVGLYGITLGVLGLISTMGIMVSINAFGFLSDNINIIAKTYEEDYKNLTEEKLNRLSNIGHYMVSFGKNFNNATTILGAVCIFIAYTVVGVLEEVDIINPYVLGSLFIGCAVPVVYCSFVMGGVSKMASKLVIEAKRQFRRFPQILRFEMRPDYEKCVELSGSISSIQSIFYTLLITILPCLIICFLGKEAFAGFLIGVILITCVMLFVFSNSSIVSKSAKKYFKEQYENYDDTEEYSTLSLNNKIYSSLADLIIPSLNYLIKYTTILGLAFLPLFM